MSNKYSYDNFYPCDNGSEEDNGVNQILHEITPTFEECYIKGDNTFVDSCPLCDIKFDDKLIYEEHFPDKCSNNPFLYPIPRKITPYKCYNCNKFFPTDAHLIEHLNFYCFDDEYIPYGCKIVSY